MAKKYSVYDYIQEDLCIPADVIYSDDDEDELDGRAGRLTQEIDQKYDSRKMPHCRSKVYQASFSHYMFHEDLARAIKEAGYVSPSKVQTRCLQHALNKGDVLCQCKTGSGKTAVFILTILQTIIDSTQVEALVIVHSRELAFQIETEFRRFAKYLKHVRISTFHGGDQVVLDLKELERLKPNIVIGTPGRLHHLTSLERGLDVSSLKTFVVDECDKALNLLDTRRIIQDIYKQTPKTSQVLFFCTIMSSEVNDTAIKFMRKPLKYTIKDRKLTLDCISQYYVELEEDQKETKLVSLLEELDFNQVLIFVNTLHKANMLYKRLVKLNFSVGVIHSGLDQVTRTETMTHFKNLGSRILITTDLLGRGIDIERVNIVINYDMAQKEDTYVRRIGRTGRFGRKGLAISFLAQDNELDMRDAIEDRFKSVIIALPEKIDPELYI